MRKIKGLLLLVCFLWAVLVVTYAAQVKSSKGKDIRPISMTSDDCSSSSSSSGGPE